MKEIFTALQNKLKVGNRRGVHLNAIPAASRYKFDIARLSAIFKSLPERFILDPLPCATSTFRFLFTIPKVLISTAVAPLPRTVTTALNAIPLSKNL